MKIIKVFTLFIFVIMLSVPHALAEWEYRKEVDEFDGDITYRIIGYSVGRDLSVGVFCFFDHIEHFPPIVAFSFKNLLSSRNEKRIRLKFDSNEPEYFEVNYVGNIRDFDFIQTKTLTDFKNIVGKMQKYTIMKLEYYLHQGGRRIETVNLAGFTKELNKFPLLCR